MRREFKLPAEDMEFLDRLGLPWETVQAANVQWLIVRGYSLPAGYGRAVCDVAIQIVANYPDAALDMAHFYPSLSRSDGRAIPNTATVQLDELQWQMWSRHRTESNPWIFGEDNLESHMQFVDAWLAGELERG